MNAKNKTKKTLWQQFKDSIRIFSYKYLKTEIHNYGYNYSLKNFLIQLLVTFGVILTFGILCKLDIFPLIFLIVIGLGLTPYIILAQFRFLYEEKRFSNAINYMLQMIYSFKKTPKIVNALMDTREVVDDFGVILIDKALDCLNENKIQDNKDNVEDEMNENIFQQALKPLEEEYGCDRLKALHDYMIHVEEIGGEYRNGLNLLLSDIQEWAERTYCYQKDRKAMKLKSILAILLSLIICVVIVNLLPEQFSITSYALYQISTTILLGIFLFLYAFIQSKINGSWLKYTPLVKDEMIDYYKQCAHGDFIKSSYIKAIPLYILCVIGFIYFLIQRKLFWSAIFIGLTCLMGYYPYLQIKSAKNIIKREIEKTFPDWIRNLSLNLQMQNVYVAIKETATDTPYVLRTELENLLKEIDNDPLTINPYNNFLKDYEMTEITTHMSMIYSLNKYGRADAERQINALIQRNNKMIEKSEILKNKDEIGIASFALTVMPEILTVIKMLVDMSLLLLTFLTMTQSYI